MTYSTYFSIERIDYGNDPFETKKWCKFFEKENKEKEFVDFWEETESCFGECLVYEKLKKKEISNDTSEVSKKDLWHFS